MLGNSLCHLDGSAQLDAALRQFRKVLRPGGYLVCDERNFDAIKADWETIKADPINNFRFNNRPDRVMYLGDDVLGAPVELKEDRVIFEYWEVETDLTGKRKCVGERGYGTLSMYAFEQGVMLDRLSQSGFSSVEVLCDLERSPDNALRDEADFYTYIAQK